MSKTVTKTRTTPADCHNRTSAKTVRPVDVIVSLMGDEFADLRGKLLMEAARQLPALIKTGIGTDEVLAAARRLANVAEASHAENAALVRSVRAMSALSTKQRDAMDTVPWQECDASFALGFVAGLQIAGGGR